MYIVTNDGFKGLKVPSVSDTLRKDRRTGL